MTGLPDPLAARVREWLADDPDPADRSELTRLCTAAVADPAALADLDDRFRAPLRFGTAGLRGPLRAGPGGMNTAVVRCAAAGLADWLRAATSSDGVAPGVARPPVPPPDADPPTGTPLVVIGYDARHRSAAFAVDTARVLAGAGLRALLLPAPLPTPVLAFAVRRLRADAGVMVTASHNPASDNGYKVYVGGDDSDPGRGAQLVAPLDADIERRIAAVGPAIAIPLADSWRRLDDQIVTDYVHAAAAAVLDLMPPPPDRTGGAADSTSPPPSAPVVAYTALHGVGTRVLNAVFAAAGLTAPTPVEEQAAPDPDFPTVRWPNPEEPGAMDRALALGARIGADLVLATDPDADRCAVAVGGRLLTGDEVGLLLADQVLRRRPGPVATTLVSSRGLRALARQAGVAHRETLTGFKWIMRADPGLVFGYEEALGYALVPELVRDKDGITAALAVTLVAAAARRHGKTLTDLLDDLAARIGVHTTGAYSARLPDAAGITAAMRRLRATPPDRLAGRLVTGRRDVLRGETAGRVGPAEALPVSDVLVLLVDDDRVIFRPSGTEPKLKVYLEVVEGVPDGARAAGAAARARAEHRLSELTAGVRDLLSPAGPPHISP
ncbi:phospho-sugar mutase [Frankia sp. AgB32]|uniref:phospho-sugar mutase n=1 Tax=Frankia sp. AgB32 TaxID=631119 RepID=UPI00200D6635|nr:phospho-sugar mutase [Frankia sp. AgB32]MCK9896869.1 phospho-sugar mutase [Frankia sp. AgB32]